MNSSSNNNITSEEFDDDDNDDEIPNPMRCRNCYSSIFRIYDGWTSNPRTGKTQYEKIAVCIECEGNTIVNHLKEDYDDDDGYGDNDNDNDSDSRKLQRHISK